MVTLPTITLSGGYLIKQFADDAGAKAGEFFTPPLVVDTLVWILEPQPGDSIYDPTSGNCSALGNLSFNWRLIMAPDFVLRYLVTHEAVHLAIPDHSQKFWLTVQSLCPETERARQWLVANAHRLLTPLPC